MSEDQTPLEQKNPLREIVQPFIDLAHSPRALWGVNLGYLIEGMVYYAAQALGRVEPEHLKKRKGPAIRLL